MDDTTMTFNGRFKNTSLSRQPFRHTGTKICFAYKMLFSEYFLVRNLRFYTPTNFGETVSATFMSVSYVTIKSSQRLVS